jgi:hypothetical protein
VAVTLHFWLNALIELPEQFGFEPIRLYIVTGCAVVFWTWLLWTKRTVATMHEGSTA